MSGIDIPNYSSAGLDTPVVVLYDMKGHWYAGTTPHADGSYQMQGAAAGQYKLGLSFNTRAIPTTGSLGKHDASYFYSTSGVTTAWSKASTVTITDDGTTTINLAAKSGARITGTLIGNWTNGPELALVRTSGAPNDAGYNQASAILYTTKIKKLSGNRLEFGFKTTSVLPGSYRVIAYGLFSRTHSVAYYTGSNKKATTSASKAKVVTITKSSGSVKIGTFNTK